MKRAMVAMVLVTVLGQGAWAAYWLHDEGGANVNAFTGLTFGQDLSIFIGRGDGGWYWGNLSWGMGAGAFDPSMLFLTKSAGGNTYLTLDFTFDQSIRKFRFCTPMIPSSNLVLGGNGEIRIDYSTDTAGGGTLWGLTAAQWDGGNVSPQMLDWIDFGPRSTVRHIAITFFCLENGGTSYVGIWPFYAGGGDLYVMTVPAPVTVRGRIAFEGYVGDNSTAGVKVMLTPSSGGATETYRVFLDADGGFALENVIPDVYTVSVRAKDSLEVRKQNVTLSGVPDELGTIVLKSGDSNGDNQVSFEDFSILQNNYGQSGPVVNPLAAAATGGCGGLGLLLLAGLGWVSCRRWAQEG